MKKDDQLKAHIYLECPFCHRTIPDHRGARKSAATPPLPRQLVSKAEVIEILGSQIFKDASAAGWLKPRAVKKGKTDWKAAKVIYALSDVRDVELRILAGDYPD